MIQERRIDSKSSQTASYTCFSRGCATREKNPQFRGPDYLAEVLFPPMAKLILNVTSLRQWIICKMFPPGIHEYVLARTKVMDSVFVDALDAHFDQIIVLGAGFDTRAIRFSAKNLGTKIFELDIATTQKEKERVLKRKHIQIPSELVFVPIDFDHENIMDILLKAGFQLNKKNLFLWEGTTMYLSNLAVDGTLEFIRNTAASGSRVIFDYIYASVIRRENSLYGEERGYEMVEKVGERWRFGIEDGAINNFLEKRGYKLVVHYSPADLERIFLTNEDGTLFSRINGTHCIVMAEVNF
jgi:methyltransferase (TIGR00027 family)